MKLIEFKANSVLAVQDDVIEIDPARRDTVAQEERAHRPYNWQLSTPSPTNKAMILNNVTRTSTLVLLTAVITRQVRPT